MVRRKHGARRQTERSRYSTRLGVSRPGSRLDSFEKFSLLSRRNFLIGASALVGTILFKGVGAFASEHRPVKVGFMLSKDPEQALQADSLIAGFDLFLKEQGSSPIQIVKKDTGPDDHKTLEALAELLMKEEVQYLVGPLSLEGSEKCIHGLPSKKAILFVTNPCVRLLAGELCGPTTFRVRPNTYQSARPLGPWALKNIGTRVFLTGSDDEEGNEEADFFAFGFERSGGTFVNRTMVPPGSKDLDRIREEAAASKADFIFASFRGKDALRFLKTVRKASHALVKPVIGPESLTSYPRPLRTSTRAGIGVRTLAVLNDPVAFTGRIRNRIGREITDSARAAEGYDIAHVIAEASRQYDPGSGNAAQIAEFIAQMEIDGPRGRIRFDKNHEPILDVHVREWELIGDALKNKTIQKLGPCASLDFGCGRVGFPEKPASDPEEEPRESSSE